MYVASRRRGAVLGFAVGTAFLAMSSIAFACTQYAGKTTVSDFVVNPTTGNDTTVSQSVAADGDGGAHTYCGTNAAPVRTPIDLTGPMFTVTVGTTTLCPLAATSLAANTSYEVRWLDVTNPPLLPMCQDTSLPGSTKVATFTTDAFGSGGAVNNATLPAFTGPRLVDICVVLAGGTNPAATSGPTVWLEVV